MGPALLIDKSALQGLGFPEVQVMHRYYFLNVPPVLASEFGGDLKKDHEGTPAATAVTTLARKLFPTDIVNADHHLLVEGELAGYPVEPDGRPFVVHGMNVATKDGTAGVHIDEHPTAAVIGRWRNREFTPTDVEDGGAWRARTTDPENVEALRRKWKDAPLFQGRLGSMEEVLVKVDALLRDPALQQQWLAFLIEEFNVGATNACIAYLRWYQAGNPLLHEFAQYGYHCCRIRLFFILAVLNQHTGRTTDAVDLEYLYYLPFTRVFVSADKFHRRTAPLFINAKQDFVEADAFRADLKRVEEHLASLVDDQAKDEVRRCPPNLAGSLTRELWAKHFPGGLAAATVRDDKDVSYYARKFREHIKARATGAVVSPSTEPQFVTTSAEYGLDDQCPCKSGQVVSKCDCRAAHIFRDISYPPCAECVRSSPSLSTRLEEEGHSLCCFRPCEFWPRLVLEVIPDDSTNTFTVEVMCANPVPQTPRLLFVGGMSSELAVGRAEASADFLFKSLVRVHRALRLRLV